MKNSKLLDKLKTLSKTADSANREHIKQLHKVLKKLKKRQKKLTESLSDVDNARDREKVEREINVLRLQREKGVELYKQLKSERKPETH